ncbi:MAG: high light inducible protein [SAR202 cluster bacterium MP-SAtl-SRR3965592-G2]|nr:MAG: high light inducible protein [SAR202 cluster bacterium MP-SAtl-SRR3965592-G2]PKB77325.1 MAG: high light inducible protein [SAR202 cluster bacterium MP-SInd-SRR3963457-G2]
MMLSEIGLDLPPPPDSSNLLEWLSQKTREKLPGGVSPVRLVVTSSDATGYRCEVTTFDDGNDSSRLPNNSILEFRHRQVENTGSFNAILLVPTGIGAEIGGHAGDATPVAQLLASVCDTLVTHPNVVNASDINEIPGNGLYVEGSVICRLLMGTAGLQPVRSNRVLVLMNSHTDRLFHTMTVNSVNAARASYGLICPLVIELTPPLVMISEYTSSSRAAGRVEDLEHVLELLDRHRGEYDAVAISSVITVPTSYHGDYFNSGGSMVNPWGGVESMLTHTISSIYDVPSAHSPMMESQEVLDADTGIVDPRMAAEAISTTFLQSILKGLQKSPRIVTDREALRNPGVFTASAVSCLVIPDGCLGLPTLAALEQGIPVIAVRENRNLMRNNLTQLPWQQGQLHIVDNYWEAAGVMSALKAGIAPNSVRRPINPVTVENSQGASAETPSGNTNGIAGSGIPGQQTRV